jgi:hypothetical protein
MLLTLHAWLITDTASCASGWCFPENIEHAKLLYVVLSADAEGGGLDLLMQRVEAWTC